MQWKSEVSRHNEGPLNSTFSFKELMEQTLLSRDSGGTSESAVPHYLYIVFMSLMLSIYFNFFMLN